MRLSHYAVQIDFNRDELYAHAKSNITAYVRSAVYSYGQTQPNQQVAPTARMSIIVNNANGDFNPENTSSVFYGLWKYGMMGRILMAYYDDAEALQWRTLFAGILVNITPDTDPYSPNPTALLEFEDASKMLVDSEVSMPLMQGVDTGTALLSWAREAGLPFPYPHRFWMLGVSGSSNLDSSTRLVNERSMSSVTSGMTSMRWLGDAHDRGDGVNGSQFVNDVVAAEMGGRFWYHAPAAGYYFRHRNVFVGLPAPSVILSSEILSDPPPVYRYFEGIANVVDVAFTPRQLQFGIITVYQSTRGIRIPPGETRTITATFSDPNDKNARVAASGIQTPQEYLDYTANTQEFGGGVDRTTFTALGLEVYAQKAIISVTNTAPETVYLTNLQLRSNSWVAKMYNTEIVTERDPTSVSLHGEHRVRYDVRMLDNLEDARLYAQRILARFAYPVGRFEQVSMYLNVENNIMPYTVNQVIGISHPLDDTAGKKYRVAGEQAQIDAVTGMHVQTWILELVDL